MQPETIQHLPAYATVHLKSTNKHVTGDIHFGKTHLTNIVLWSKEGNCPTGGMAQFRILAEIRPSIAEHFTYWWNWNWNFVKYFFNKQIITRHTLLAPLKLRAVRSPDWLGRFSILLIQCRAYILSSTLDQKNRKSAQPIRRTNCPQFSCKRTLSPLERYLSLSMYLSI